LPTAIAHTGAHAEYRDDQKGISRLPELLASDISEECAATAKIDNWLKLSDKALTADQPSQINLLVRGIKASRPVVFLDASRFWQHGTSPRTTGIP
jgi:hypothetical protein